MAKSIEERKKEINPEEWYKPREIANNKWINCATKNKSSNYYFILKLINRNRLKAKDRGLGKTSYYIVRGSEIIRYLEKFGDY